MKTTFVLALPVTFFLGVMVGRAAPEKESKAAPAPGERRAAPEPRIEAPEPDPVIERQRKEIEDLRAELDALKPVVPKARDRSREAEEIYDLFVRAKRNELPPDDRVTIIKRLGDLDPSMTAFFISKYRSGDGIDRETAFVLAILSGGPEASRFAAELLQDSATSVQTRRQLLRSLAGIDDMPAKCTAEDLLTRLGIEMTRSMEVEQRAAAAGILGMGGVTEAPVLLRSLADSDPSDQVRAAAFLGLGRTGDASARDYLKAVEGRAETSDYLKRYVRIAIGMIERRLK